MSDKIKSVNLCVLKRGKRHIFLISFGRSRYGAIGNISMSPLTKTQICFCVRRSPAEMFGKANDGVVEL